MRAFTKWADGIPSSYVGHLEARWLRALCSRNHINHEETKLPRIWNYPGLLLSEYCVQVTSIYFVGLIIQQSVEQRLVYFDYTTVGRIAACIYWFLILLPVNWSGQVWEEMKEQLSWFSVYLVLIFVCSLIMYIYFECCYHCRCWS